MVGRARLQEVENKEHLLFTGFSQGAGKIVKKIKEAPINLITLLRRCCSDRVRQFHKESFYMNVNHTEEDHCSSG